MNKTLIAYYFFSGNTRTLAESIAVQISGELLEVVPRSPYAFDYNTAAKEARSEITRMAGTPWVGLCISNGGLMPEEIVDLILKEATP